MLPAAIPQKLGTSPIWTRIYLGKTLIDKGNITFYYQIKSN